MKIKPKIGIIGSGWVGGSYLRDLKRRGFNPICYSLERKYISNKDEIKNCDIVFIAVPTPTKPTGFDYSALKEVLKLVSPGKIAVIKSTILPGITSLLQKHYPKIYILHSPEFLTERSANHDASHPKRNIIGIPKNTRPFKERSKFVLSVMPKAPFNLICSAEEAELIKYARNIVGYLRVVFYNLLYEVGKINNADWKNIQRALYPPTPIMVRPIQTPSTKMDVALEATVLLKIFLLLLVTMKEKSRIRTG